GGARNRWCPSPDEQGVVLSMGGSLDTAVVLPAVYSNQVAPPSDSGDGCGSGYPAGGWFEYVPGTGRGHVRGRISLVVVAA
ncbi:phage baseplate assembly protein V, partial [Salmonella enterica]|uniref:phage baseplate assembly protein V n=1 Tax=Salmonella enterica TaxID=28901 RepID=UPI003299C05C